MREKKRLVCGDFKYSEESSFVLRLFVLYEYSS